jgi:putative transposase
MRLKHDEFAPRQYYHVYNHAVPGQALFRDNLDYENGVNLMAKYYLPADFAMVAYCLMPNHYHVLLYQKTDVPAYAFINKWSYAYARYFNTRHRSMGTIFSDKLQSISLKDEKNLLRLCANIHLNPVRAELVNELSDWEWSNYPEWIKLRSGRLFDSRIRENSFPDSDAYQDYAKELKPEPEDNKFLLDV